jgi:hypothetical protein
MIPVASKYHKVVGRIVVVIAVLVMHYHSFVQRKELGDNATCKPLAMPLLAISSSLRASLKKSIIAFLVTEVITLRGNPLLGPLDRRSASGA